MMDNYCKLTVRIGLLDGMKFIKNFIGNPWHCRITFGQGQDIYRPIYEIPVEAVR